MIVRGEAYVSDAQAARPVSVYMSHTAYRVAAGHRLRLHLASSDFPLFLPLLGDGDPWRSAGGPATGYRITAGGGHPSFVDVHVLG
jgi:predicted acyl esterase